MNDAWNDKEYNKNAAYVSAYGEDVLEWLAPVAGEKILDVGCGEGTLGLKLKEAGIRFVGIDSSLNMVKAAQEKGLDAYVIDAAALTFGNEFDAIFSNAVLHWVRPPEKAAEGVYQALKPGGRFVAEFGGEGNIATIKSALIRSLEERGINGKARDPWYFPSAQSYKELLEKQGFIVKRYELFERRTLLPTGIEGWLKTFGHTFLAGLSETEVHSICDEVAVAVHPKLCNNKGEWFADYVRLRVKAVKK